MLDTLYLTRGTPPEVEVECGCGNDTIPRRPFLKGLVIVGAAVAGFFGGAVNFAHTAFAAPRCDATPPVSTSCGPSFVACVGPCSDIESCCQYGPKFAFSKCCGCFAMCAYARVVVYSSGKTCKYCCQYC